MINYEETKLKENEEKSRGIAPNLRVIGLLQEEDDGISKKKLTYNNTESLKDDSFVTYIWTNRLNNKLFEK